MRPIWFEVKPPLNQRLPSRASVMLPPISAGATPEAAAENSTIGGGPLAGGGIAGGGGAGGGEGAGAGPGAGAGAGGGGAATGLPARLVVGPLPPPHAASVAAKATASRRIARSFIDTSCNRPPWPQVLCQTPGRRAACKPHDEKLLLPIPCGRAAQKCQSCKQLHPKRAGWLSPLPGILAYHSRKLAMATPTEH